MFNIEEYEIDIEDEIYSKSTKPDVLKIKNYWVEKEKGIFYEIDWKTKKPTGKIDKN